LINQPKSKPIGGESPRFKENQMKIETILDYLTAIAIGVGMAFLLAAWLST
jgi:hypothetical protein